MLQSTRRQRLHTRKRCTEDACQTCRVTQSSTSSQERPRHPQPAAWNMVHQPSPISMFESTATSTANATPRRAPSCAPTSNAATVTGWMFGKGCITTRKATTETTNVANPANRIGVGRGAEKKKGESETDQDHIGHRMAERRKFGSVDPYGLKHEQARRGSSLSIPSLKQAAKPKQQAFRSSHRPPLAPLVPRSRSIPSQRQMYR